MDNSGAQEQSNPVEALLRSADAQLLVGCPAWCSWAVCGAYHEHWATKGAEVVVSGVYDGWSAPEVLEVRHSAVVAGQG